MNRIYYIYVDDERQCNIDNAIVVRNYNDVISVLQSISHISADIYIDLDHDLGEGKSGYDIAKWIVEEGYPLTGFHIHSMNLVGAFNIRQLLTRYGYKEAKLIWQ